MPGYRDKPLRVTPRPETGRACLACKTPHDAASWPRNKWTLTGWSPWCPSCHARLAPASERKVRRGRKSNMEMQAWTNLPS